MIRKGKLFIVSAPSGAGKTTLINELIGKLKPQYNIEKAITYTSRDARAEEQQGIDYHFIPVHDFEQKISEGYFLEYSTAYGTYYGTPSYILSNLHKGNSYILVIDRAGAKQIKMQHNEAVLIWIDVPSIEVLEARLRTRGTNTEDQIQKRLEIAKIEIEEEKAHKTYNYHIINDIFENTLHELSTIIVQKLATEIEKEKALKNTTEQSQKPL
jgi:guanylate kinase